MRLAASIGFFVLRGVCVLREGDEVLQRATGYFRVVNGRRRRRRRRVIGGLKEEVLSRASNGGYYQ